jgi:hypothetical protein
MTERASIVSGTIPDLSEGTSLWRVHPNFLQSLGLLHAVISQHGRGEIRAQTGDGTGAEARPVGSGFACMTGYRLNIRNGGDPQ